MKILWFSNTAGSAAEYLRIDSTGGGWVRSLENSMREKVDLHIAFYYPRYSEAFEYNGIHYYPICKNRWKLRMFLNLFHEKFIDKEDIEIYHNIINKVKPDLIHIHGTENPFGCLIDSVNLPIVVSIQGNATVCHHKFFSGIERAKLLTKFFFCSSFRDIPFLISFNKVYKRLARMRDRETRNLKKCKYVIGRTDWDFRITRVLAPESKYFHGDEVLRNAFYTNQWKSNFTEKLIIHTTNGNSPYKGFETICQSLSLLVNKGLDIEWRVAGIKEKDLIVKVVKNKFGKAFPKKGLRLLGNLDEKALVNKLLEANIYIMPSHIENSPNNLCEAMMIGMPCIATFAGGTGSLLEDGKEGILIQDGDPWAMAGAIIQLMNDPTKAVEMGRKAKERALTRHDRDGISKQYLKVYSEIIADNHR
jgi:glycosyltransferase involved in cell wall biosynthesis